ncbi:hypothetical protein [Pseudanabaena sp. FACHB-2040]|uniref:hypothetical protein n=1 Tax=Pseudanabaena sp. FACHB-2040 TaxID=2692859 RepID=UPI001689CB89|nr:hypothetical protein [Pseudanabaena sp. FACHB-2040]MBD2256970.1 hypothetical protein [Pseudanabaena sp. FACHB-2040]
MRIHLYQTAYDTESRNNITRYAKECWLDNDQPELWEYQAYLKLLKEKAYEECDYIGLFSPKFPLKTRLSTLDVVEWIAERPGHDVYTFNPFPALSYFFFNQWEQGEHCHTGLKELAQKVFDQFGLGDVESAPRILPVDALYCNFWVGTSAFFKTYVELVEEIILFMLDRRSLFLQNTLHRGEMSSSFLTFILERIFTQYVTIHRSSVRKAAFTYPDDMVNHMIDDVPPYNFDLTRMILKIVRPLIEDLDTRYQDRPDERSQYLAEFNQINQQGLALIAAHGEVSALLQQVNAVHKEGSFTPPLEVSGLPQLT